jgi:hypothetical protein
MTDRPADEAPFYDDVPESNDQEPYGSAELAAPTERELALRLVVSRAVVDAQFYERLRSDPEAAIDALHVRLDAADMERIRGLNWDEIDEPVALLRRQLGLGVVRGGW